MDRVSSNFKRRVAAAAKVFEDYGGFIENVIRSNAWSEDQVADLSQDFFISLILNPLPEDLENVEAYLYKTIVNSILDANRRTRKYRCFMRTYAGLSCDPVEQKTPHELLVRAEEAGRISKLMETRLPNGEARALALRYRKQYDAKEAAEEMGVNNKTFRAYVCEGLSRIRRLLRNVGADVAE